MDPIRSDLIEAVRNGKYEEFQRLLGLVLANDKNITKLNLLNIAVINFHFDIINYLLASEPLLIHHTDETNTPLHFICMCWTLTPDKREDERIKIAKVLLANEAGINAVTSSNTTPVNMAVECELYELAKYLIMSGANYNIVNYYGDDVKAILRRKGNVEFLQWLDKYESTPDVKEPEC